MNNPANLSTNHPNGEAQKEVVSKSGRLRRLWSERPWFRWVTVAALVFGFGLVWFLSREQAQDAPKRDVPVLEGDHIRFSWKYARRVGMTTAQAKIQSLSPVINVTGTIAYDLTNYAAIGARVAGRVRKVHKFVGDKVKVGDILLELESAELGRAQSQLLTARARELAAESNFKRERHLADSKISSEHEAEQARASYEAARAERIAAEKTLQAFGASIEGDLGVLRIKTPVAGKVVGANLARGQTVQPSDNLYEVANLDTVWVELAVFERQLPLLVQGDAVEIRSQADPNYVTHGTVAHVGDVIAEETRSAVVRVVIPNQDEKLRPGQSISAKIHASGPARTALSIPRQAVTHVDGKPTVFVLVNKGLVAIRQVKLGGEDNNAVTVNSGVKEGEAVVVDGVFALKSELFR